MQSRERGVWGQPPHFTDPYLPPNDSNKYKTFPKLGITAKKKDPAKVTEKHMGLRRESAPNLFSLR